MANIAVDWEVEGIISPEESVSAMIRVIETKKIHDSGRFFTWEGKVSTRRCHSYRYMLTLEFRSTRGKICHFVIAMAVRKLNHSLAEP